VFGWAVVFKKAAVCCELWKKLLWVMSCEKIESRLVENCCEASFFRNFKFQTWKIVEFSKFQISNVKNCRIFKISNFWFEKLPNVKFEKSPNFKFETLPNFRFENLLNFRFEKSHSQQKHLSGCFQNWTMGNSFSKSTWDKVEPFGWLLTFCKYKST
jgi:hypothetical protein